VQLELRDRIPYHVERLLRIACARLPCGFVVAGDARCRGTYRLSDSAQGILGWTESKRIRVRNRSEKLSASFSECRRNRSVLCRTKGGPRDKRHAHVLALRIDLRERPGNSYNRSGLAVRRAHLPSSDFGGLAHDEWSGHGSRRQAGRAQFLESIRDLDDPRERQGSLGMRPNIEGGTGGISLGLGLLRRCAGRHEGLSSGRTRRKAKRCIAGGASRSNDHC
jgi:hypothetical protein